MNSHWIVVTANIGNRGGQDKANSALVRYLLERGAQVTLVCHSATQEFLEAPLCHTILVPRILDSYFLGHYTLARKAKRIVRKISAADSRVRVLANGGNFVSHDLNWFHCVHHAWQVRSPSRHESLRQRAWSRFFRGVAKRHELRAARAAKILIANSKRTKIDIEQYLQVMPQRVVAIPLGADPALSPPSEPERTTARKHFNVGAETPVVVFVGALDRDDHKGFGCLFSAWQELAGRTDWKAKLLVAGDGNQLPYWRDRVSARGGSSIEFLGFVEDIPQLLAAADLLVSPVRYEGYGLNVQEAICRGVPAFVSRTAGIAERYPAEFDFFLLENVDNPDELVQKILEWGSNMTTWRSSFARFSTELRQYAWQQMAADIVSAVEDNSSR